MRQFLARNPKTYWLPRLSIEPSRTAALAVRSQISRASSGVSRASAGRPIRPSAFWIRSSETRLRKGDCSSCIANPWRSVPSNTGSPVVLVKSARTIVSLSVSLWCAVKIEVPCDDERQHSRGSRNDHLPAFCDAVCLAAAVATGCHPARIRVPLQALEVGANVRRVLVAQVAIFFEALVDDALQFRRHVGIQAHRRHGRAVENGIENDPRAFPAKWQRARRHFVEHHPEREQIRARVQRLTRGLAPATCTTPSPACCRDRSTAPRPNGSPGRRRRSRLVRTPPSRDRNRESSVRAQSGRCSRA